MNSRSPIIREAEMNASALESFGGQKIPTETFSRARALRRWIAAHPACRSLEMPAALRGYLGFLQRRHLVTCRGRPALWSVVPA
jgi:hypothetical protein